MKEINDWEYDVKIDSSKNKLILDITPKQIIPTPKKLVKYYDLNAHNVDALKNSYLYASHPYDLNDPFDCYVKFVSFEKIPLDICVRFMSLFGMDEAKVNELYNTNQKQLFNTIQKQYYDYTYSKIGIISMTLESTDMQMWAYYCGHKGFQIIFKTEELKKIAHGPFPINYTKELTPIEFSDNAFISTLFQTNIKSSSWIRENEWRFLYESFDPLRLPNRQELWDKQKERKLTYLKSDIDEIVLGFLFFDPNYATDYSNGISTFNFTELSNKDNLIDVLEFIVTNLDINVSLIYLKDDFKLELTKRLILIEKIKDNIYSYKLKV